jgi:uncharacterized protein YfdQ (DUF2303 family)
MTDTIEDVYPERGGDTAAAIIAGRTSVTPKPLSPSSSRFFVQSNPITGDHDVIDTTALKHAYDVDHPHQPSKNGQHTAYETDSLIAYVNRHATEQTELWANVVARNIVAIIDGDSAAYATNNAGWAHHRMTLQLRHTPAWDAWVNGQGLGDQEQFAEHLESRQIDIVEPRAADLLELAQTFKATKKADFESSKRLGSGQTTLEWREDVAATAGKKGEIDIPDTFTVALRPFRGGPQYKVTARLRYRVGNGQLAIGYILDNPTDVIEAAFDDITKEIREALADVAFFHGSPQ